MELPDDATKSPKLLFLLGDAAFLGVATFLALTAGDLPSTASIVGIIVCTGIGVALGIAPFLLDYARSRDQQLTERQNAIEALVRTTSSASDQASIAANGLHEIAEITKKNLQVVEQLPAQIQQAKTIAQSASEENHAAAVSALQQDLTELRAAHEAHIKTLLPEFKKVLKALEALKKEIPAATEIPLSVASAPPPPTASSAAAPIEVETPAAPKTKPASPKKKKAAPAKPPRKAPAPAEPSLFEIPPSPEEDPEVDVDEIIVENASATPSAPPATDDENEFMEETASPAVEADFPAREPAPDSASDDEPETETEAHDDDAADDSPFDEDPPAEPAISADGLTRLTVTAYIGIGNRLFVRGNGPGLSPDEGVPLQFVSIGKWRWETDAATTPFSVTLWKNDSEECTAAGQIKIAPGAQIETTANF